jgi:hypothetical protein
MYTVVGTIRLLLMCIQNIPADTSYIWSSLYSKWNIKLLHVLLWSYITYHLRWIVYTQLCFVCSLNILPCKAFYSHKNCNGQYKKHLTNFRQISVSSVCGATFKGKRYPLKMKLIFRYRCNRYLQITAKDS